MTPLDRYPGYGNGNKARGAMAEKPGWLAVFLKRCCVPTVLLVFLVGGCYALFKSSVKAEGAELAGPITGFLLWFGFLYVRQNKEYRELLGKHSFRHGRRTLVAGVVQPLGPLLTAPFSGKECVGYYYVATHPGTGRNSPTWTDYEGYALAPFVIRSRLGDARPLPEASKGFLERLPKTSFHAEARAVEYLEQADFGEKTTSILGDISHKRSVVNGPGDFRCDLSIGEPPRDPRTCTLEEAILRPHEQVHAIGVYSEAARELLPDPDNLNWPLRVEPGDERALTKKIRRYYTCAAVCVMLAAAVASIYFMGWIR